MFTSVLMFMRENTLHRPTVLVVLVQAAVLPGLLAAVYVITEWKQRRTKAAV